MNSDKQLRKHVLDMLEGGQAHAGLADVLQDIPPESRGRKPKGLPYTPWRLLEHMRVSQKDIVEYTLDPGGWESPDWPDEYWPVEPGPPSDLAWEESVEHLLADNRRFQDLVANPETQMLTPLAHTPGHTVLRQALLSADHNAYHLGQLFTLRRLLGLIELDDQPPDSLS